MPENGIKINRVSVRRHNAIAWLIIAVVFFLGARFIISNPADTSTLSIKIPFVTDIPVFSCPFYFLTGLPCPFCGITRSVAFMVRGDIAGSFDAHPLGPLITIAMAIIIPLSIMVAFSKEPGKNKASDTTSDSTTGRWTGWVFLALFAIAWIISLGRHFHLINW